MTTCSMLTVDKDAVDGIINFRKSVHLFTDPRAVQGGISTSGEVIQWPQIVINNISKHAKKADIEKYFTTYIKVPLRKLKVVPGRTFCFASFDSETDRSVAIAAIKENKFKNSTVCYKC